MVYDNGHYSLIRSWQGAGPHLFGRALRLADFTAPESFALAQATKDVQDEFKLCISGRTVLEQGNAGKLINAVLGVYVG